MRLLTLFDTHAHLDDPQADELTVLAQLRDLRAAGWRGAVVAGYGPERFARSRELCAAEPLLRRAIGLHPEWLAAAADAAAREAAWHALEAELDGAAIVALGEIGVDRRVRDVFPAAEQQAWLARGLGLAAQRKLPVMLHIVGWHGHALEVLRQGPLPQGGVVHRFSGAPELVREYEALGLHMGISLEPREDPVRRAALVQAIAADRLVLETDWPLHDLSYPESFVKLLDLAAQVAQWRGVDRAELAAQLARNAQMLYRLDPPHGCGAQAAE